MLPNFLSLPALSSPALSVSKGRRVEGQAKQRLKLRPRRSCFHVEYQASRPKALALATACIRLFTSSLP